MKIEFHSISFRNFLTFGNKSQYLDLKPGINLITGFDKQTGRSNGSGKSSLINSITFALFGRVNQNLNKDKIVNWKNRKNCEVEIQFNIGINHYKVKRGIKPDFLEIYKDMAIIPQPPDVRQYQKILENDILHMDFHTFISLVHININNYTPFLQMDTPKKRLFIEKMFGLEMFSDLNKLAHEKLGMMENQLSNYNTELSIKSKIKNDISQKYSVLNKQVKGLKSSNLELTKTIEKLANLEDPKNLIDLASTSGSKYELQKIEIDQEITKQNTSMDYLNKEKETILGELSKKENLLKQQKSLKEEYEKIIKENNNIDELICSETEILSKCDKEISDLTQLLSDQKLLLVEAETNLEHYSSNLHTLSDKTECPLCMSKINKDTILPNIQTLIKKYESLVTEDTIKISSINEKIKDLTNTKDCTNLKELKKTKVLYQDAIAKLEGVDALIASINIQADQQKLSEINENISKFNIKDLKEKSDLLKKELDKIDKILKVLQKKSETYNKLLTEKTILEEKIIWEEKTKSDLRTQINSLEKEMSDIDNECNKLNDAIEKLTTLKDYVSYVKTLCKDENIKQYAISSIMPYLTKRINEYLARAGMSYFVNFNNLLEDDIRGPGIYGASYGNLSGGEARSMDLAILFSLLDISRLQFGVFPDILMLDELLDSSIDKNGIDEIMKIVWLRQMEDNSKIFLVTHRSDWTELTGMRKYKVEKESGFSSIKEIEE